uniref:ATPase AAA-type core domain-containing protein n=1 Tax=Candidatus Kentrum sp. FW TaxID=2126338 RepID=A0A450TQ02_9GAMM|nr:MAG: hypothetical protein BECKFW1821C_GA0114237_102117 [Candidatus Kentron sp. FW]
MIISASIENWMCFRDPVSFSMVAGKERQHGERVPRIDKYQTNVLPIAAIYGGNASGKTAFFKALNFAKRLVVRGTGPDDAIPVERFRLDSDSTNRPSRFVFEILVDKTIYEFGFAVTKTTVLEEKLIQITSASEKVLFHRRDGTCQFHASLAKDQFLQFAFRGTRDNQLFLTNSVSQKVDNFRKVYDWFKDTLVLIDPDSKFAPFEQFLDESHPLYRMMNQILPQMDTGISHLGSEKIPFENVPLPDFLKTTMLEDTKVVEEADFLTYKSTNEHFMVTRENDELIARKLFACHPGVDGTEIRFNLDQESDGSQRVLELLPAFLQLSASNSSKVYIIDEIDRSLHTLLIRRLIETYLASCTKESRSQLLFTTHDVLLMDQQLFRRDEMWVAERNASGVSDLISFSEYKDIRYDKDIRKSYLQGRMGGIPRILLTGGLSVGLNSDREMARTANRDEKAEVLSITG